MVVAANGRAAVEALESGHFQQVLMDIQMPGMDGFEATAAIRQAEKTAGKHTPIVAMTAHALKGDQDRCIAAGMDVRICFQADPQYGSVYGDGRSASQQASSQFACLTA